MWPFISLFWIHLPKDTLCQVWLKLAEWFFSRWFWKIVNVCSLFDYYLLLEKCRALKLNKNVFKQNWLKLSRMFWEEVVNVFSLCSYCLPLIKGMPLHLHKLELLSHRNALFQVWWLLRDSKEVIIWKDMGGHLDRQTKN